MSDRVIRLDEHRSDKVFPRKLFVCNACYCRTFKLYRVIEKDGSEGPLYVECANCEADISFDDL